MTSDLSSALEVCIDEMHYTNRRLIYFTLPCQVRAQWAAEVQREGAKWVGRPAENSSS